MLKMHPQTVILDCREELVLFKAVVCGLDMPTVDLEAAVGQIFYAVGHEYTAHHNTMQLAHAMSMQEALFENSELDNGQQVKIYNAVVDFCDHLIAKLKSLGAYDYNGQFPYENRTILNDGSIILNRTKKKSPEDHT